MNEKNNKQYDAFAKYIDPDGAPRLDLLKMNNNQVDYQLKNEAIIQEADRIAKEAEKEIEIYINTLAPNAFNKKQESLNIAADFVANYSQGNIPQNSEKGSDSNEVKKFNLDEFYSRILNAYSALSQDEKGPIKRTKEKLKQLVMDQVSKILSKQDPPLEIPMAEVARKAFNNMSGETRTTTMADIFLIATNDNDHVSIGPEWPGLQYRSEEEMLLSLWDRFKEYLYWEVSTQIANKKRQELGSAPSDDTKPEIDLENLDVTESKKTRFSLKYLRNFLKGILDFRRKKD